MYGEAYGRGCQSAAGNADDVAEALKLRLCLRCLPLTDILRPEVHDILHYRQRKSEPRPHVTRSENFVKFGRVVFEIYERRDRHTDTLIATLCCPPWESNDLWKTKNSTPARVSTDAAATIERIMIRVNLFVC